MSNWWLWFLNFSTLISSPALVFAQTDSQGDAEITESIIFTDQLPSYPGGDAALYNFINRNSNYPVSAKQKRANARVFVSLEIDDSGKITEIEIEKGFNPVLDAEALRVARLLKSFNPPLQNGKPVKSRFIIPFQFSLRNSNYLIDKQNNNDLGKRKETR